MMFRRIFLSVFISLGLHAWALVALVKSEDISPIPSHAPFQVGLEKEAVHRASVRKRPITPTREDAPLPTGAGASESPASQSSASQSSAPAGTGQSEYLSELAQWIESRKEYPVTARRLGQEGQVEIGFTIGKDGAIREARLTQECRYGSLNEAALVLARGLGRFKPLPEGMGLLEWKLRLPINYRLQK